MSDPYAGTGSERPRVAVVVPESPTGDHHHAELLEQLLEHGVPGHDIDVIPSNHGGPHHHELVHLLTDDPAWRHAARDAGVPLVAGHDLPAGDAELVLSPSRAADDGLIRNGVHPERIARVARGVDVRRYHPARYAPDALPTPIAFNILHVGDAGLELAVEAFGIAHDHNSRLRLVLAGGPSFSRPRTHTVHLPDPTRDQLAELYASSDLLLATGGDDAGEGILEAQASGLPVLALNAGAAPELVANGRSGCLIAPEPLAIGSALHGLARRAALLERLATGGLLAIRTRTWEAALEQLAAAYTRALQPALGEVARAA